MHTENLTFTVTARRKDTNLPIGDYLRSEFPELVDNHIDSVFGFVEPSPLYGGRNYIAPELSDDDVLALYKKKIGLRLPLTNKFITREEYEQNELFLQKYHREGNAVITYSDELATWIRQDFPLYKIEASVIKELHDYDKIKQALEIYDTVVLMAKFSDDFEFLQGIDGKEAITLFANAGCAYNCPSRICYTYISRMNKSEGGEFICSKSITTRDELGVIEFDLKKLSDIGFQRFKLLRTNPQTSTGY